MKLLKRRSAAFVLSNVLRGSAAFAGIAATFLVFQPSAHAQQGVANVVGVVRDASTKAPLADVVVTITSPSLQGEQTVVTDSSGSYRIPALPPGDYAIHLDKEGFKPGGRGGIALRVDATIRVNMELLPEGLKSEEIVVVGKAPVVDVGSSSTGVTVNQEFTTRVPLNAPSARGAASRSFEDVAITAPGARSDDYGISLSGTTSVENQYLLDGLSVNDVGFGFLSTPLSVEFIDQVAVITGGYMPEYGRATGGVIDAVTKSGSNEYHGSAFFSISPGALEGFKKLVKSNADADTIHSTLSSVRDFGATIGGPIVKDKLWFFAGVDFSFQRYRIDRTYNYFTLCGEPGLSSADQKYCSNTTTAPAGSQIINAKTGFAESHAIPNSNERFYSDGQSVQAIGKLTYNINQDHHVTLSFVAAPQRSGGNGTLGIDNQLQVPQGFGAGSFRSQGYEFAADSYDTTLRYDGSWDNKRWLLNATLGWHHQHSERQPNDGSTVGANDPNNLSGVPEVIYQRSNPSTHSITDFQHIPGGGDKYCKLVNGQPTCAVSQYFDGGPGYENDALLDRWQAKAGLTRFFQLAGHHVAKAGIDLEFLRYQNKTAYTGGDVYEEGSDGSYYSDSREYGSLTAPDKFHQYNFYQSKSTENTVGGYIQDSWQIMDKVTINAGVRYDGQWVNGSDGRTGINLPTQVSPRVGFVWDPTHEGKSKIFGNFARFYESIPLDIADRTFPGQVEDFAFKNAATCNPLTQGRVGQACQSNANTFPINGAYSPTQRHSPYSTETDPIDPDLHPQSNDEWVVGGEYEIFESAILGLSYTHRYQNYIVEDMSNDEGKTFFIGNPGYGIAGGFPKAIRNYDAVSLYFNKAFGHEWLATASYTIAALRGNWSGLENPATTQLDPNINSDFDLRSLLPNRYGPLPGDRTHSFKIFGAKDFSLPGNWLIQIGASFSGRSGDPTNYLGAHVQYGAGEVYILPRGSGPRLPWVFDVDTQLSAGYKISKDSTLLVGFNVFNIFDFQQTTAIDENFTFQPVSPLPNGKISDLGGCRGAAAMGSCALHDPSNGNAPFAKTNYNSNFGQPLAYQAPREWRFTARVTF